MSITYSEKNGWRMKVILIPGKPQICINLGRITTKKERTAWEQAFKSIKKGLSPSQRATMSSMELKQLCSKVLLLNKEEQSAIATRGIVSEEPTDLGDVTRWKDLIKEYQEWSRLRKKVSSKQDKNRKSYLETIQEFLSQNNIVRYNQLSNSITTGYEEWRKSFRKKNDKRPKTQLVSASSMRHEIQIWKDLVDWAISIKGLPDHKVFYGIKIESTAENTQTIVPLEISELQDVFKSLRNSGNAKFHDLCLLAYLTGSERKALKWLIDHYPECLDKNAQTIQIFEMQISGTSGGKTEYRGRLLPITPTIQKIFDRGLILGSYNLDSFIENNLRGNRCYKLPFDWHIHQMRHSYATHNLTAGVPVEEVSRHMGHSSIQQCLDRYARFSKHGIPKLKSLHEDFLTQINNTYFDDHPNI